MALLLALKVGAVPEPGHLHHPTLPGIGQMAVPGRLATEEGNVSAAIVGATRPEQVRDNVKASGVRLEADLMKAQVLKEKVYPADIARMALFLASDDSRLISAQNFVVDGGRM